MPNREEEERDASYALKTTNGVIDKIIANGEGNSTVNVMAIRSANYDFGTSDAHDRRQVLQSVRQKGTVGMLVAHDMPYTRFRLVPDSHEPTRCP
jgi:hypothetical protein